VRTFLIALLFTATGFAQELPSRRECRSQAAVWSIGLFDERGEAGLESSPHLSAQELLARSDQMAGCYARYKKNNFLQISRGYYLVYQWRVFNFVNRHDLLQQFAEEDQAGKR
jgi:hypothetical protein